MPCVDVTFVGAVMCCASYGMLISVQYEGSWACAVNGRMRTHFAIPRSILHRCPQEAAVTCCMIKSGLLREGNWR